MKRELKFRLWDSDTNRFIYFDVLETLINVTEQDQENVQQYTGLKDKNGKEIYEGDIVNYFPFKPINSEVIWKDGYYLSSDEEVWPLDSYTIENDVVVVVGNIFQNPELLIKN